MKSILETVKGYQADDCGFATIDHTEEPHIELGFSMLAWDCDGAVWGFHQKTHQWRKLDDSYGSLDMEWLDKIDDATGPDAELTDNPLLTAINGLVISLQQGLS